MTKWVRMNAHTRVAQGESAQAYKRLRQNWRTCTRCTIGTIAHAKVHVRGSLPCDVLFVGEGPGKTEDMLGVPFVGRAGKLLDLILPSIQEELKRQWAIVNLVACRPTEGIGRANRKPTDEEVANCEEHLTALVELAQPKTIVLLGREAQVDFPVHLAKRYPILHAYHPAYLCRKGGERAEEFEPWKRSILQFIREQT